MKKTIQNHPVQSCTVIFTICALARVLEYFVLRTDETILAENVLHKIFGLIVLAVLLCLLQRDWQSIGFGRREMVLNIGKGLALGGFCFAIAYTVEYLLLSGTCRDVSLSFYVSGFSLNGETAGRTGIFFLALCVLFNLINVWMEEGLFRGLFMNLLSERLPFPRVLLLTALYFGVWHWVMPLRDYAGGNSSFAALFVTGLGYLLLAGMMSVKWSLLYRMTGSLWMGLADHFFNNTIATNLLHVIAGGEADSLQIVRVLTGQTVSFLLVLLLCQSSQKRS